MPFGRRTGGSRNRAGPAASEFASFLLPRAWRPSRTRSAMPSPHLIRVTMGSAEAISAASPVRSRLCTVNRSEWRVLDAGFLDQAGLGFLSAAAFRFYLPAFLLADLDGALTTETPSFYLSHGLNDVGKVNRVNPRLYTERTWFDHVSDRFAAFTADEAGAILGYLSWIAHHRGDLDGAIAEAVGNFWLSKSLARETPPREPPGVDSPESS